MGEIEIDESTWIARLEYSGALFRAIAELRGPELDEACAKARQKFIDTLGEDVVARLEAKYGPKHTQ